MGGFDLCVQYGRPELVENKPLFKFNADGTLSLHPSTVGLKEIQSPEDVREWVVGYGHPKEETDLREAKKGLIHVRRDDPRRVVFSFTFEPTVRQAATRTLIWDGFGYDGAACGEPYLRWLNI